MGGKGGERKALQKERFSLVKRIRKREGGRTLVTHSPEKEKNRLSVGSSSSPKWPRRTPGKKGERKKIVILSSRLQGKRARAPIILESKGEEKGRESNVSNSYNTQEGETHPPYSLHTQHSLAEKEGEEKKKQNLFLSTAQQASYKEKKKKRKILRPLFYLKKKKRKVKATAPDPLFIIRR